VRGSGSTRAALFAIAVLACGCGRQPDAGMAKSMLERGLCGAGTVVEFRITDIRDVELMRVPAFLAGYEAKVSLSDDFRKLAARAEKTGGGNAPGTEAGGRELLVRLAIATNGRAVLLLGKGEVFAIRGTITMIKPRKHPWTALGFGERR